MDTHHEDTRTISDGNSPLSSWKYEELANELDERIAHLFKRAGIVFSSDGAKWAEAEQQLESALLRQYQEDIGWLRNAENSCACGCVWRRVVDLIMRFEPAFKPPEPESRAGRKPVHKQYQFLFVQLAAAMKEELKTCGDKYGDETICAILEGKLPRQGLSESLQRACDAYNRDVLSKAQGANLYPRLQEAKAAVKADSKAIELQYFAQKGVLSNYVRDILDLIPHDIERKQNIIKLCGNVATEKKWAAAGECIVVTITEVTEPEDLPKTTVRGQVTTAEKLNRSVLLVPKPAPADSLEGCLLWHQLSKRAHLQQRTPTQLKPE